MPQRENVDALVRGLAIGVAAGCRSTLGLLGPTVAGTGRRSTTVRLLAAVGIVGELVGDKLPRTPSRAAGVGPLVRAAAGAVGALQLDAGRPPARRVAASVAGAVGGIAGTWGGYGWRRLFARRGLPDWPAAVTEDAFALALAVASLRTATPAEILDRRRGADRH